MPSARLQRVFAAIDHANSQDPNLTNVNGEDTPNELLYGQRMSTCLDTVFPNSSECLQIAARAQHIERWKSPRTDFPEGRSGYKKWRSQLALFHGQRAGEIMEAEGYSNEEIERVKFLILKRQLKRDEETQALEDVICLVFLEYYFEPFIAKHSEEKIIDIVQKTWAKMSDFGQKTALKLSFSEKILNILQKSLA